MLNFYHENLLKNQLTSEICQKYAKHAKWIFGCQTISKYAKFLLFGIEDANLRNPAPNSRSRVEVRENEGRG